MVVRWVSRGIRTSASVLRTFCDHRRALKPFRPNGIVVPAGLATVENICADAHATVLGTRQQPAEGWFIITISQMHHHHHHHHHYIATIIAISNITSQQQLALSFLSLTACILSSPTFLPVSFLLMQLSSLYKKSRTLLYIYIFRPLDRCCRYNKHEPVCPSPYSAYIYLIGAAVPDAILVGALRLKWIFILRTKISTAPKSE